jgi:hypothetical protein
VEQIVVWRKECVEQVVAWRKECVEQVVACFCKWLDYKVRFQASVKGVRFEVFTAVTMKNSVFCDVTPCGSCKNRRFGGT